jgi:hypothetical protein
LKLVGLRERFSCSEQLSFGLDVELALEGVPEGQ